MRRSFEWLSVILALFLAFGFLIGACVGDEEQQVEEVQHVIALTDLDFNNDGYINDVDLTILKAHFNERYSWYVPWDLNADLRCDVKDFYYFADRVPLDYRYRVAANISAWNMTNYTIDKSKEPALILDELVYPQNINRTVAWVEHYTSLESPKDDDAVCVDYTRDLCKLAYKNLGPKTIAWGSSGVHTYGMIYTGGDWQDLANWYIVDPYWQLYDGNIFVPPGVHETHSIEILLDEGRYGYWAIHLSVDYPTGWVYDPYKAEYRIGTYREPM